jgi:predicted Zn-dependent protease
LKQKNAAGALSYLKKAWRVYPNRRSIRFNLAMALSLTGNYQDAQKLLEQTDYRPAQNITTLFCLIENSVRAGDGAASEAYAEELLSVYKPEIIRQSLDRHMEGYLQVPLQKELITIAIESRLAAIKEK